MAAVRPSAVRRRSHDRARAGDPAARRARRHRARAARRARHRGARDATDRAAHRQRRARSSAPATPGCTCPCPRPTTRSRSLHARSRGCSARSMPRAARRTPRSSASASSSRTPRTSCARRSRACWRTSSCWPRSSTASRPTPPRPRCARRGGCAGWSATCCCSRAPTRGGPGRAGPTDLADVLLEAASELGPMAEDHELSIDARPAVVPGVRDDLHRLTLNLIENAARHTPAGTHIRAVHRVEDGVAVLTVEDDGPGIPPELGRARVRALRPRRRGPARAARVSASRSCVPSPSRTAGRSRSSSPKPGTAARFVIRIPATADSALTPPSRVSARVSRRTGTSASRCRDRRRCPRRPSSLATTLRQRGVAGGRPALLKLLDDKQVSRPPQATTRCPPAHSAKTDIDTTARLRARDRAGCRGGCARPRAARRGRA